MLRFLPGTEEGTSLMKRGEMRRGEKSYNAVLNKRIDELAEGKRAVPTF